MIPAVSDLSQARPAARLFRAWTWLAGALAFLPVIRTWQLTGDTDTTVTTLAVFAGAAWQMAALLPVVEDRPNPGTRQFALLLLGLGIWQLAWVPIDDFWFFRLALILWGAVWLLLAWGWLGFVFGWRILTAFTIWAVFCDGPWQWSRDAYQSGDFMGPALAVLTAQISAGILYILGAPLHVARNVIQLGGYVVSVGVPCTALPLVKLLLLLLLLATLLFRLEWRAAVRLGLLTALVSFAISVVRVMLLAYVVRDARLFHYWHDADGGGGGWFTAAGMLAIAFLMARQVFRQQRARPPAADRPPARPVPAWTVLAASAAALTLARLGTIRSSGNLLPPPASPAFGMVSDSTTERKSGAEAVPEPNQPIWVRHLAYAASSASSRLNVIVALIPRTLTGDPLDHPSLDAEIPLRSPWSRPEGQGYAAAQSPAGSAWVATVAPGEAPIVTGTAWNRHLRQAFFAPSRWLAWLAHRAPLRDKRSYWLAAYATPASAAPPKLFTDWIAVLARSP